jgi:hypothetical protein
MESRKQTCGSKNINSDIEIDKTVTQSRHRPAPCSGSATLKRMNDKDGGAILKLSDVDRGTHTIEFVTLESDKRSTGCAHLGSYLALT